MDLRLPGSWRGVLGGEVEKPYFEKLMRFVEEERGKYGVYPPEGLVFSALELTGYEGVRVVILGQDPYPNPGQAHGLAFSVGAGVKWPASLRNIFKELQEDLGVEVAGRSGDLTAWAKQGVLLLNTVLTVRAGQPLSHRNRGWELFTDAVIGAVSDKVEPVVFALWGGEAQKKLRLIDAKRHVVVKAAHPSPLSARAGFFGSRPFSRINEALERLGRGKIDWGR